jgi:hypothetical protein
MGLALSAAAPEKSADVAASLRVALEAMAGAIATPRILLSDIECARAFDISVRKFHELRHEPGCP